MSQQNKLHPEENWQNGQNYATLHLLLTDDKKSREKEREEIIKIDNINLIKSDN